MKRIPPGQIDRLGRQLEKMHFVYIERWVEKGYIGAQVFDQQFCKLFDMLNAEAGGASSMDSSYRQRFDESLLESEYEPEEEEERYTRPTPPTTRRTPPSSIPQRYSGSTGFARSTKSSYKPKSAYFRRRSR